MSKLQWSKNKDKIGDVEMKVKEELCKYIAEV